jgi:hypothetical protein
MILNPINNRCERPIRIQKVLHDIDMKMQFIRARLLTSIHGSRLNNIRIPMELLIPYIQIHDNQLDVLPPIQDVSTIMGVVSAIDRDTLDWVFSNFGSICDEPDFSASGRLGLGRVVYCLQGR